MEINGSYFRIDISQSAMLFELMHGLEQSIMIKLNGKYYEHTERKFRYKQ